MILNLLFFAAGLIVGWNLFKQPAAVEAAYDRVAARVLELVRRLFPLFILAIFITGCGPGMTPAAFDYSTQRAMAEIAIASTTVGTDPVPIDDVPKVGDKCPDCNDPPGACGVGKVGDGRVCDRCGKCGGDGRIDQRDIDPGSDSEPSAVDRSEITLHMTEASRGGWPAIWYSTKRQAFEDAGWPVRIVLEPRSAAGQAYFDVVAPDGEVFNFFQAIDVDDIRHLKTR